MKKHKKIIAIQGDPLNSLNRKTDTTLLLALEAQKRGYKIYYYETKNLTFSKVTVPIGITPTPNRVLCLMNCSMC